MEIRLVEGVELLTGYLLINQMVYYVQFCFCADIKHDLFLMKHKNRSLIFQAS